jgi:hypothetical protein
MHGYLIPNGFVQAIMGINGFGSERDRQAVVSVELLKIIFCQNIYYPKFLEVLFLIRIQNSIDFMFWSHMHLHDLTNCNNG